MQAKTAQETPRKAQIARLRQMMQAHDMRPEDALSGAAGMAIGFDAIDADLPQGLAGDALHEVVAARLGDFPAALGFAWHLAARFTTQFAEQFAEQGAAGEAHVLYGQTHGGVRDIGQPYAPALHQAGLSPTRLIYLDGVAPDDLLWAGETALACPSIGCTVLANPDSAPNFTASRRLSMAAANAVRPILLVLGAAAQGAASAATTRWHIRSLPKQGWQVQLLRQKYGVASCSPASCSPAKAARGWAVYPARPVCALQHNIPLARPHHLLHARQA